MIGVVFVRRLREGKTYDDFRAAWYPDVGFGVPARVISGAAVTDPREIITVGFVDAEADDLADLGTRVAEAEAQRHEQIDEVIESTEIRSFFVVTGDDDFTSAPRALGDDVKGFPWRVQRDVRPGL